MGKRMASLGRALALSGSLLLIPAESSFAASGPKLSFDLTAQGRTIHNAFSDINAWDYEIDWTTKAAGKPANTFATNYPFVKNVQFMTATGGCYVGFPGCSANRDLFADPSDRTTLTDYDFSRLIGALHHVVDQGLKPHIKTGNIPMKLSDDPEVGVMEANLKPPSDYDQYYAYIKALADALVAEFGLAEVKTWTWGVFTEYENPEWFDDGVSPASTQTAFFKIYDYTVAALEDAIGASNLTVGAHSMTVTEGLWDELAFIDHVAGVGPNGTNYKTGLPGTQIDFLTASFYDLKPGVRMPNGKSFVDTIETLRKRAVTPERIERMVNGIVRQLESSGEAEIPSSTIGELVMEGLKGLDDVAYVRFAPVYKTFREAKDFEELLGQLGTIEEEEGASAPLPRADD